MTTSWLETSVLRAPQLKNWKSVRKIPLKDVVPLLAGEPFARVAQPDA
jgi:hypothetical protein